MVGEARAARNTNADNTRLLDRRYRYRRRRPGRTDSYDSRCFGDFLDHTGFDHRRAGSFQPGSERELLRPGPDATPQNTRRGVHDEHVGTRQVGDGSAPVASSAFPLPGHKASQCIIARRDFSTSALRMRAAGRALFRPMAGADRRGSTPITRSLCQQQNDCGKPQHPWVVLARRCPANCRATTATSARWRTLGRR